MINLRKPDNLDHGRARMANENAMMNHFQTLKDLLVEHDLLGKLEKLFHVDESGINMDIQQGKVVVTMGSNQAHSMSQGARDHITVNCCINANGECIPPMIIFEKCFPSTAYVKEGITDTLYTKSTNGYMDEELFFKWFADHFIPLTNHLGKQILFIDGHGSHISLKVIDAAKENNIILYCLPPHMTHVLQPLNVSVYKPIKNHFSNITDFIILAGVTQNWNIQINKTIFPIVFKEGYEKSMTMSAVKSGFCATGIYPFNPNVILKDHLMPSESPVNGSAKESTSAKVVDLEI